jgi:PHD/YefM family antitoxin component YafN of YafNO toxin-antitoxin module
MIEITSPSSSNRTASEFIRQLKETGYPVVVTLNGKAELVVQDAGSYQRLLELAERAEVMESIRVAVEDMCAGKGKPIEEMFAELRAMIAEKRAK